jgi:hypothetical protein
MANPYQQQVFHRKLIYIGLILVLFTGSWLWRNYWIQAKADELKIREKDRGEVELSGAAARVGVIGFQGLLTCILWRSAMEMQAKNQWNELRLQVDWLTRLQPHFITPWLFQSWNLSYNVSVESDRVADKYYYITEGINLLARGERQNANNPDLRWSIGFYTEHKICKSDETNLQRSLFQLSLIPPHERDPARFWKTNDRGEPEFNYVEFEKFCAAHPQLVRRLRIGMHRDSVREKKRLFTCERPEDVVQFLQDNYQIPTLWAVQPLPPGIPASSRTWVEKPDRGDVRLEPNGGFPVLPPPHADAFDREALTYDKPLHDDTDAFDIAGAWYCYALEPIPPADKLPGSTQPITDPVRQRKNKHMTTLIFRSHPAQARRFHAERLQEEGWYDDEDWDITDWFEASKKHGGLTVKVGGGKNWSLEAWQRAKDAWTRHGNDNHLLFKSPEEEENTETLAGRYRSKHGLAVGSPPPRVQEDQLSPEEKEEYDATRYLAELTFYRHVSNFLHHYHRSLVEAQEETVAVRKAFYRAETQLYQEANRGAAMRTFEERRTGPGAWKDRKLNPLEAWRDLVLLRNEDFRRDDFVQERTAEIELRYLDLYNGLRGQARKEEAARLAALNWSGLGPGSLLSSLHLLPTVFGPFDGDVKDKQGKDLPPHISAIVMQRIKERMNLVPKKRTMPPEMLKQPGGPPPLPNRGAEGAK